MEDTLWWKTTFDGTKPLMDDNLWSKTTFDGGQPLTEYDIWWKTTIDGRQPLTEDTFDGRWPLMEDCLWQKTTFDGKRSRRESWHQQWRQDKKFCKAWYTTAEGPWPKGPKRSFNRKNLDCLKKMPQSGICPAPCVLCQCTSPFPSLQYICNDLN